MIFCLTFFSDKLFSFKLQISIIKQNRYLLKFTNTHLLKFQVTFQDILLELKDFKSDSEHIIRSLLYFTLIKLNRLYSELHLLSSETENNTTSFMFKQSFDKMRLKNNRTIDFYSQKLGVSRITLNKCVKKHSG
ncbi:hypothetical protein A9996_19415 [Gelidibacter algens]|nr:hypothetical protein A9996_19415 [Gelidibacter algens]